ncbi:TPA: diguanylate cyclase [Vibrio cholerae]|uniref:sensor domain-containing diguanylate cyclase n=1 Tax=Shewanella algae TaxID=38313 RepID=UPI00118340FA|nr:diguanylate cyclase [Shewanella algae]TVL08725.1 diguanylate cyclase [Shewanella algae]HDL9434758.1 diguanylate cyclase [Vibrio cholerae]
MGSSELSLLQKAVMQSWNAVVITSADRAAGYPVEIANPAFCKMTGYAIDELYGQSLKMLQGPATDQEVINRLRHCLTSGEYFEGMTTNYRKDGSPYLVRWNISPVRDEEGDITHFVSVQQDMTAYAKVEETSKILGQALDAAAQPILVTDAQAKIIFANQAFCQVSDYEQSELIGNTPSLFKSGLHDDDFYKNVKASLMTAKTFQAIFINKRKDGTLYHSEQSISAIKDLAGNITNYVSVGKDVTERLREEQALRESATVDQLTGLFNRNHGKALLSEAYSFTLSREEPMSLILCDIDHFKQINDSFGHPVGDQILAQVSGLLRKSVRGNDRVIRWGGEEFLILLENCTDMVAAELAERLRLRIASEQFQSVGKVTVSLGVASLFQKESLEQLISRCDEALYKSKRNGRNQLTLATMNEFPKN